MTAYSLHILANWGIITGSLWFIFAVFDRRRRRAQWARLVLGVSGIIGVAYGVTDLMLDARWLVLSDDNQYAVHTLLHHMCGLLLGFLLSVIIAGEIRGSKTDT